MRLERSATRAEERRTAAALGLTPSEAADEALAQADAAAEEGEEGEGGVDDQGTRLTTSDDSGDVAGSPETAKIEGGSDDQGSLGSQRRPSAKERRKQKRDAMAKKA